MATFKLILREDKTRTDGTAPVYLRITHDRRTRQLKSDVAVEPKHWNKEKEAVRRSHPSAVAFNDALRRFKSGAERKLLDIKAAGAGKVSALAIKRELEGAGATSVLPYIDAYAESQHTQGNYWEWKKVKVLRRKLQGFHGNDDLAFGEIDQDFLERFDQYMRVELKNQKNTRAKNLQILHRVVKAAIRDGLVKTGEDPFYYFKIGSAKTTKERLTLDEIDALEDLALPPGSPLAVARDAFLFSFYCAGVRFGDLCRLEWQNVTRGTLRYQMAKTGTAKDIEIPTEGREILKRYRTPDSTPTDFVFPILEAGFDYSDPNFVRKRIASKNTLVNGNLKRLAKLIGTDKNVSFHVSRHSYADFARRAGIDLYTISKSLGHSSLKITERYMDEFDAGAVNAAMRKGWEQRRSRKRDDGASPQTEIQYVIGT